MNPVLLRVAACLAKLSSSEEVRDLVANVAAVERFDDPPFRYYLSNPQNGVSLLFEYDHLIDIQVTVEPTKSRSACPFLLPFGLARGMNQLQVHAALGIPDSSDESDSHYTLWEHRVRLVAAYGSSGKLSYLSLAPIEA